MINYFKICFSSKKINIANSAKSQLEVNENTNQKKITDKRESQNSNSHPEKAKKDYYDDSPKNLANFFNGEIIDLEE